MWRLAGDEKRKKNYWRNFHLPHSQLDLQLSFVSPSTRAFLDVVVIVVVFHDVVVVVVLFRVL